MNIGIRVVRPISRKLVRAMRVARKFVVLTTLSTISVAACQDGADALGPDAEREIVFRHFV